MNTPKPPPKFRHISTFIAVGKNPKFTKKGPGRRHQQGRPKTKTAQRGEFRE